MPYFFCESTVYSRAVQERRKICPCHILACFKNISVCSDVLLTVHLSIFISVINQLDAKKFCFTISLFHVSTCFEHMCSSSPIGVTIPEAV